MPGMKLYTKTGDEGKTSLYTGERVDKGSLRVETYGTLDEFQAFIGLARTQCKKQEVRKALREIEVQLVQLMAEVASLNGVKQEITEDMVTSLELEIDRFCEDQPAFTGLALPGETPGVAALHLARTVVRRAERLLWRLSEREPVGKPLLNYVNRLSDYCYALARYESITSPDG